LICSLVGYGLVARSRRHIIYSLTFKWSSFIYSLHILVRGLIDLDAEIAKCEKKLQLVRLNLDKVRKVEAQLDYVETVPENVRSINEDRKKTLEAEVSTVEASKEMFAQLK